MKVNVSSPASFLHHPEQHRLTADTNRKNMEEEICKYIVMGAGGVATVALTPALLAALGFTTTGIAAGSIAAKMMSLFAVFYGGGIPAGGLMATLQSLGMTGLGWFGTGAVAGAGSTVGWMISKICNVTVTVQDNP